MHLLSAKKRIVNFRLTQDEYETLQKACSTTGARSISDYARSILLGALPDETGAQRPDMARRIDQLEMRVSALSAAIRAIESILPGTQPMPQVAAEALARYATEGQ